MKTVTSNDGTLIAYDIYGSGPALILVGGALQYRAFDQATAGLAQRLAKHFTVYHYDRRGRGDSGDTVPYSTEKELEDLEALIAKAGGSAFVYGMSSGGALVLDAAAKGLGIKKIALYEPPLIVDDSRPPLPDNYVEHLSSLSRDKKYDEALEYFMTTAALVPVAYLPTMKQDPSWEMMKAVVHTTAYDGAFIASEMRGKMPTNGRWNAVTIPVLLMTGGNSPDSMAHAAQALHAILPNSQYKVLPGQDHGVTTEALAPQLEAFFGESHE